MKITDAKHDCITVATPAENLKLNKTFDKWMEEHANFRTICEEGKGKNKFLLPHTDHCENNL